MSKLKIQTARTGLLTPPDSPLPPSEPAGRAWISRPVTWTRLKHLIDHRQIESLGRSLPTHQLYHRHMAMLKQQHGSVASYLTNHVLADFIAATPPNLDQESPITADDFLLLPNDFPYYLADGVQHWVMWCRKPLKPGFEAPPGAKDAIMGCFGQVEFRYFVNPVAKQSVPQLSHAHAFVK